MSLHKEPRIRIHDIRKNLTWLSSWMITNFFVIHKFTNLITTTPLKIYSLGVSFLNRGEFKITAIARPWANEVSWIFVSCRLLSTRFPTLPCDVRTMDKILNTLHNNTDKKLLYFNVVKFYIVSYYCRTDFRRKKTKNTVDFILNKTEDSISKR